MLVETSVDDMFENESNDVMSRNAEEEA